MNILFVTSEIAPFAKTGGLGDVCAALPRALARRGHDVRVFTPLYQRVAARDDLAPVAGVEDVPVRLGARVLRFSLHAAALPGSEARAHFISCPQLYDRPGLYTADRDEHLRFLMLVRGALVACQQLRFAPDVAHCHDWQAAMLPLILRCDFAWDRLFARTRTMLTIHNLHYQGMFRADILPDTGLGGSAHLFHQDQLRAGLVNFLMTGALYADAVTTVSPTYAREIQTDERGGGMADVLRRRSSRVFGILNGVDYGEWSPETDRFIPQRYSAERMELKQHNKEALLRNLGLGPGAAPVVGIVSRLAWQKGFELGFDALPWALQTSDLRLAVLGSGEPRFEEFFAHLESRFRGRVCFYRGFSEELAHLVEAGADLFLMPSRHEPCGLNQMYSLRYGTVPIVRKTGGLADTVEPWNRRTGEGTGFVFEHFTAEGLRWALGQAFDTWKDASAWRRLQRNGMAQDFSWDHQVLEYEALYGRLTASE